MAKFNLDATPTNPWPAVPADCIFPVDWDLARKHGHARQGMHMNGVDEETAAQGRDANTCGVAGEFGFAEYSGLKPNLALCAAGDGKIDFRFKYNGFPLTIDVKTAWGPKYLLVKVNDAPAGAKIYVLAGINETEVHLIGWEHKSLMLLCPQKKSKKGWLNYQRPNHQLRPMAQLLYLIQNRDVE